MTDLKPACLLHTCCAPCVTHSWQVLKEEYDVTIYFYNPNIHPIDEYEMRVEEIKRLGEKWGFPVIIGPYDVGRWFEKTRGMDTQPEGGERCRVCYKMRFDKTAEKAVEMGIDHFTSTLSISPHKASRVLFDVGRRTAQAFNLNFVETDFKKKDGFKKSCLLSHEEGLYRQDYCGCIYSQREAEARKGVSRES